MRSEPLKSKSGLEIAEEAIRMVRFAPIEILAVYYLGSLPFVMGLITFWAAMERSANAYRSLPFGALLLALLFIWMKTWQARYCRLLLTRLRGAEPAPWPIRAFLRNASMQGYLHATGFIVLPIATILAFPLAWTYAAYQNILVLDDGTHPSSRSLFGEAIRHAQLWPRQNHLIVWLLSPYLLLLAAGMFLAFLPVVNAISPVLLQGLTYLYAAVLIIALLPLAPFGMIIAVNIGTGILLGIALLGTFSGIETVFSTSPSAAFNDTFVAIVCGLTYLCMDPVLKAAYVLRCFHGGAIQNGEDLRVQLRRYSSSVILLLTTAFVLFGVMGAHAQTETAPLPSAMESQQLDRALDSEISHWRYTWRMPRAIPENEEGGFLENTLKNISESVSQTFSKVHDWISKIIDRWFNSRSDTPEELPSPMSIHEWLKYILLALSFLLTLLLGAILLRSWRRRREADRILGEAAPVQVPDITDENVNASELPESRWRAMAEEFIVRGEYRMAIRALFLAILSGLAQSGLIRLARHKTNYEYLREILRRGVSEKNTADGFSQGTGIYESIWYGGHEATLRLYEELRAVQERLPGHALE